MYHYTNIWYSLSVCRQKIKNIQWYSLGKGHVSVYKLKGIVIALWKEKTVKSINIITFHDHNRDTNESLMKYYVPYPNGFLLSLSFNTLCFCLRLVFEQKRRAEPLVHEIYATPKIISCCRFWNFKYMFPKWGIVFLCLQISIIFIVTSEETGNVHLNFQCLLFLFICMQHCIFLILLF